ncbi:aldo/keto reductase [Gloeobacter morelensis]|uniref:Aldo/keto reductase n=1 Tax=Gloeobacter morelensis MG652769 TaxID=2781736 RepID=A0ABY3PQR8_9CYAN|nr:aldo/keto reductase [Gloeobacter morelensis]UFP96000.1 aldo/keto reductase [Gloeobacter morelensis MG652769]
MLYRRFGKTDLRLSVFTFGAMRYLASKENAVHTVKEAVRLGINHLETARGYGESEKFLGAAFRAGVPRDKVYVTTKIPPTPDGETMRRQIEESLSRLGIDRIDIFDLHGINTREHLELSVRKNGCLDAIRRAMAEGLIGHLGFSTHGPLPLILDTIATGEFESVNLHYYYFNQRNAPAVELAHRLDMGVFIISPTDKGGQLFKPPARLVELCAPYTPIAVNHRFLLCDPRVHTLSLGAANAAEFAPHLAVADLGGPLSAEEAAIIARLDRQFREIPSACEQCYQCLPCPEAIHIPEVLRLRNLAVGFEMDDFARYRYNMFGNAGHWFPGTKANSCTECGDCLPRCPVGLDIPALLGQTHQMLHQGERKRLWG